ncbi:hypothetical protein ACFQPG_01040 [Sphingomonas sp. GCM10030256]|uniref:hypothetical protein n=1 Tax=Sphingomonas sp. GCM10030256 TaxID=3273427 RepID=UPI00360C6A30
MHPRLYRLTEAHQRIDRALRDERGRSLPDPLRLTRLQELRLRVKQLIGRFARRTAWA